jgi:hypothetical protein
MGYTSIILTELDPWQAAARIEAMTRTLYDVKKRCSRMLSGV